MYNVTSNKTSKILSNITKYKVRWVVCWEKKKQNLILRNPGLTMCQGSNKIISLNWDIIIYYIHKSNEATEVDTCTFWYFRLQGLPSFKKTAFIEVIGCHEDSFKNLDTEEHHFQGNISCITESNRSPLKNSLFNQFDIEYYFVLLWFS